MAGSDGNKERPDHSAYSQANEVRKKIALVEGKRRALFSEVEREKKSNREMATQLDDCLLVLFISSCF